jgi:hypothetical protein
LQYPIYRRRRQAPGNGQAVTGRGGGDTLSVNAEGFVVASGGSSHNISSSIAEVHTNGNGTEE